MEGKALRVAVLDAMNDHTPTVRHPTLALVIALLMILVLMEPHAHLDSEECHPITAATAAITIAVATRRGQGHVR